MKPILYYQLTKYALQIVGVTSESRYGRINGRHMRNDAPAHWRTYDLIGRFDTFEAALAKVAKLDAIRTKHGPLIKVAHRAYTEAEAAQQNEINAELKTP